MMIQVCLKTGEKNAATKFEVQVAGQDTVKTVCEKVAAAQLIAFPEHKMVFKGETMEGSKTMADSGIEAGSSVEYVVMANEDSIVKQLKDLLKSRDLTADELGLLYCYKHGVSINQALKTIGQDTKLADFLKDRKEFVMEKGKISMVRDDTSLKPLSVADQLEQILRENNGQPMEVTALCSKFIQKFHVSVANVVQMRPLDFIMQEKAKFALVGSMVTLKENEAKEKAKAAGSSLRMARSRSPQTARQESGPRYEPPRRAAQSPARARPQTQKLEQNEDLYQDLHTRSRRAASTAKLRKRSARARRSWRRRAS
jgi:hypothetical protein